MKRRQFSLIVIVLSACATGAQDLPYGEIPNYPDNYSAGTVAARMVDGLGFRYYWVTEGLRAEDLEYQITEESRTSLETIEHIYGLSKVIINAVKNVPNGRSVEELDFTELRKRTLLNFKESADILRSCSDEQMEKFELIFGPEGSQTRYPFWNNLNGPIADALWHTGQVVMLRRASGNAFNSKVSVFNGTVRDQD